MAAVDLFKRLFFQQSPLWQYPESVMQLGMLLRGGMPLAEAFYRLSQSSAHQRVKSTAGLVARRLSSGEGCDKVFAGSDMAVFSPSIRYILAAPFSDVTKGRLIADWKFRHKNEFRLESALFYPLQSLFIGVMTSLSLFIFVFPQMREIFLGLEVKTTPFVSWLLDMCGEPSLVWHALFIAMFVALLSVVVVLTRRLTRFPQKIDEMNLLRMLAVLPAEERLKAFDVMSVRHNFPALHNRFRMLARAISSGGDAATSSRDAGLDDMLAWFLALGLLEEGSEPKLLLQAGDYLNASVESSADKTISLIEVSSVLFQAIVFGSMAYALVQMMISMTQGIAL
ncbi:MAG: type II secretion system F family protein [Candidatus Riflebacteria bacterium]|nr:type II secretion system F family protein [Candidatus Riflebacteria bacterium]